MILLLINGFVTITLLINRLLMLTVHGPSRKAQSPRPMAKARESRLMPHRQEKHKLARRYPGQERPTSIVFLAMSHEPQATSLERWAMSFEPWATSHEPLTINNRLINKLTTHVYLSKHPLLGFRGRLLHFPLAKCPLYFRNRKRLNTEPKQEHWKTCTRND